MDCAKEKKITASSGLFLVTIVWVNNFQIPEIQAALSSFFATVMILQVVAIGLVGGLNIRKSTKWNVKTIGRSSLGPYWTFFVLTALQIEDIIL